ncbi:MAG: hypothetical protein RR550_02075, partial [Rikenellaceae bacterium]
MAEIIIVETKVVRSKLISFLCLSVVLLSGCASGGKDFQSGWSSHDEYFFDYTSMSDSLPCSVLFHFMPDREYRYKNFNFELLVVDPHFKMYKDTVSVMLDTAVMFKNGESAVF